MNSYIQRTFRIIFCLLAVLTFISPVDAQVPHIVYGEIRNNDNSIPGDEDIIFNAFLQNHSQQILTKNTVGQTGLYAYPQSSPQALYWLIQCSDFSSDWSIGDVLEVQIENVQTGEQKIVQVTLTDAPSQNMGLSVLPIELRSFTASYENQMVVVRWITGDETNCLGFNLHRSEDHDGLYRQINQDILDSQGGVGINKEYEYKDFTAKINKTYYYKLEEVARDGARTFYGPTRVVCGGTEIPRKFNVSQNYPNPFNQRTKFRLDLPNDARVSVKFYDVQGAVVRVLWDEDMSAGSRVLSWDGSDIYSRPLPSGIYICKITAGSERFVKKFIIAR